MMGIYKFTNVITGQCYIGQSVSLESRYKQHYHNHLNPNTKDYQTKFYQNIREYGMENFSYEILEQAPYFTSEELNHKEIYWIEKYDSYHNGLNSTPGGQYCGTIGEDHPMSKLKNEDVLEIKHLLKTTLMLQSDIAAKFGVEQSVISEINSGKSWGNVGIEYTYPIRKQGNMRMGGKNPNSVLTDEMVMEMRNRYVNETAKDIYENGYKDICSYIAFERALMGRTFGHLPIYKKREKVWITN